MELVEWSNGDGIWCLTAGLLLFGVFIEICSRLRFRRDKEDGIKVLILLVVGVGLLGIIYCTTSELTIEQSADATFSLMTQVPTEYV